MVRLDMDIAGPQLQGLFEQVVDRPTTGAPLARSRRLSMSSSARVPAKYGRQQISVC
jgi:hypothetical protein